MLKPIAISVATYNQLVGTRRPKTSKVFWISRSASKSQAGASLSWQTFWLLWRGPTLSLGDENDHHGY